VSDGVARATDLQSTVENPILRISYDAERDFLWAVPPDAVIDGHMDDEMDEPLEGLFLYRRGPDGAVFGFGVDDAFGWEVMGNVDDSSGLLWGDELCFDVPTLALRRASVGEIVLAAQSTIIGGSTPDVVFFSQALQAADEDDREKAERFWRACLEAGDLRAHFGLGYTLVELERPREAFGHLVMYTELTPRNSWAWHWRGQAAEAMGDLAEAKGCFRRAVRAEDEGSFETDAEERLAKFAARDRACR